MINHQPRTAIIDGPLAFAMRRLAAARGRENGLQILTLPQVAARLAGGFLFSATPDLIEPAVQRALLVEGFVDLAAVAHLPGMTRAATATLRRVWDADIDLATSAAGKATRWADLARIEEYVRSELPRAAKLPRDIRQAALANVRHASRTLGAVRIEGLTWIAPVWRGLVNALCAVVTVEWVAPDCADTSWFSGIVLKAPLGETQAGAGVVTCADPHHEAVEALRWVRQLLSSGHAKPTDIAIAAASTTSWDDHFQSLVKDTGLRIHFSHGIPALSTRDGQRCAALCDILLHGLSEGRVRRLVSLCAGEPSPFDRLPDGWIAALPRGATLLAVEDWRRAVAQTTLHGSPLQGADHLMAVLKLLAKGPDAAVDSAKLILRGRAGWIWDTAIRNAPPEALEISLQAIRLPDELDPGTSVVWCPAAHLAAAPRPWVRLLGLTAGKWPRRMTEDALLPHHIILDTQFEIDPQPEADRRSFAAIIASARGGAVFSRSRRNARGNRETQSPLLLQGTVVESLSRTRVPDHAFSEVDRLMARPAEAADHPLIASASRCWQNWHRSDLTAHDGRFSAEHPVVKRAIARVQSPTSLRLMLRDPLGFVWRYALDWQVPKEPEQPLTIPADQFGRLVHELLRRAVDTLEAEAGLAIANQVEIDNALQRAAQHIEQTWPLLGSVPPSLLWRSTLELAVRMSTNALRTGETTQADTRSWTEVRFGDPDFTEPERSLPWNPQTSVTIPETEVRVRGSIDRLDLRTSRAAARVTDYKTGARPDKPKRVIIGGGNELQRTLYGLACRQLLPDHIIKARLIYLKEPTLTLELEDLDAALEKVSAFVNAVCALLRRGIAVPGPDVDAEENDLRLAAPASPSYGRRKRASLAQAARTISSFWSAP